MPDITRHPTQQVDLPQGLSFVALGGEETVTRNMYLYEYNNQILIVDCGLGFPDETMLGVDLLLPDISYLLDILKDGKKKIVGMVLTHGHEDHIGGLPFILPQLPPFPLYASPFTAALSNEKLREFEEQTTVQAVKFTDPSLQLGEFNVSFIRITHSVPDSANFFIKTPAGNFFHGSDFKFDLTPHDGKRTDFAKIAACANEGVTALMSDCLGSDRQGHTPSEADLGDNIEREMRDCQGRFFVTTYSSNVARVNQIIHAAERVQKKVCFVGRSVVKVKEIGQRLGYIQMRSDTEVQLADLSKYQSKQLVFIVAGSQGQENSALTRIANGDHREIRLDASDVVLFSSDPIPGNEIAVNELMDTIAKKGAKAIHSLVPGTYHVSGHGSSGEHMLLIALTNPRFLVPISGTYRHMVAYQGLSQKMGYQKKQIFLLENGQSLLFTKDSAHLGKKFSVNNIYVDQISGEEVEHFVVRDRERLGKEGVAIVMVEISGIDGQLANKPEVVFRGSSLQGIQQISSVLKQELEKHLIPNKEKVTNWIHMRKLVAEITGKYFYKKYHTRPLILPVVIEV